MTLAPKVKGQIIYFLVNAPLAMVREKSRNLQCCTIYLNLVSSWFRHEKFQMMKVDFDEVIKYE